MRLSTHTHKKKNTQTHIHTKKVTKASYHYQITKVEETVIMYQDNDSDMTLRGVAREDKIKKKTKRERDKKTYTVGPSMCLYTVNPSRCLEIEEQSGGADHSLQILYNGRVWRKKSARRGNVTWWYSLLLQSGSQNLEENGNSSRN